MLQVDNKSKVANAFGILNKMQVTLDDNHLANYYLVLDKTPQIFLNDFIGKNICLEFSSLIRCVHCNKNTKTSYNQGHCYVCATTLAKCDLCIVRPKTCHYHLGTCREPSWGEDNCFTKHIVYLANSSGIKVGIARSINIPDRWIDQGAIQALPIISTLSRYEAGLIEAVFATKVPEQTNWRKMLNFTKEVIDLVAARDELLKCLMNDLTNVKFELINNNEAIIINYPISTMVNQTSNKINLTNLHKSQIISGILLAIKGQYLIFEHGIVNIRSLSGYEVYFKGVLN